MSVEYSRIVDLTMTLTPQTRVFPGYPQPVIHKWATFHEEGYYANFILLVEHTGTHMDSPAHFVPGAPSIDKLPPSKFIGKAVVLDFTSKEPGQAITKNEVKQALEVAGVEPGPGWYVLFAMGWDKVGDDVWLKYPYIEDEAARYLARLGIEGIGLDSPSPDYAPFMVHKILLPQGTVIIENMAGLTELVKEKFTLIVTPLKIGGGSASPVRALALFD